MQRWLLASAAALAAAAAPRRVAVTGAGGQTGQLAFRRMLARRDEFDPVWKSKFYGASLNHRVGLHAIDATPARWRGDAGSFPHSGRRQDVADLHPQDLHTPGPRHRVRFP